MKNPVHRLFNSLSDADSQLQIQADTLLLGDENWINQIPFLASSFPNRGIPIIWVAVILLALFLLFTILSIVFIRKWHKKRTLQIEAEESQTVIALLKDRVSLVESLVDSHEKTTRMNGAISYPDELESLQSLVDEYHAYLEGLRNDLSLLNHLEEALNKGSDNLMVKARKCLGDDLSTEDYLILSCLFAGMKTKSISFLTRVKPGTIRTKKSRMKRRIEEKADKSYRLILLQALDGEP